jgi:hypothetical protein
MDPVQTETAVLSLACKATEIGKNVYDLGRKLKDEDQEQQLDEVADEIRKLKRAADELEDQKRELREKLRFKSDDYALRIPFRYHKDHPDQPLCVECFSNGIEGPMGELGHDECKSGFPTVPRLPLRCFFARVSSA